MAFHYSDGTTEPAIGDHARNGSLDGYVISIIVAAGRPTPPPDQALIGLAVLLPLDQVSDYTGIVFSINSEPFAVVVRQDYSLNLTKV